MLLTGPVMATPEFDPDAYLMLKRFTPFNPDAYLHEKQVSGMAANVGSGEAFLRGGAQGATLGFGDELQGAVQAGLGRALPESMGGFGPDHKASFSQDYTQNRDTMRRENEAARKAHAGMYGVGEAAGGLLPTIALGGVGKAAPLLMSAGQGAAQGAGYSDADTAPGIAADSALGAGLGLIGYGAGKGVDALSGRASRFFQGRIAAARARAAAQAAEEETTKVASLAGKYGGARQNASRATEILLRSEGSGLLDPAAQAAVQAAKANPAFGETVSGVAKNYAEDLGTLMPAQAAAKAEMQAAQQALPQAVASRTAELTQPSFGKDAASLAKSYIEPLIWAAAAQQGANALGMDPKSQAVIAGTAGLIGGRTRAGKALMLRFNRPGNQIAMSEAGQLSGDAILQILKRGLQAGTPVATQQLVGE